MTSLETQKKILKYKRKQNEYFPALRFDFYGLDRHNSRNLSPSKKTIKRAFSLNELKKKEEQKKIHDENLKIAKCLSNLKRGHLPTRKEMDKSYEKH